MTKQEQIEEMRREIENGFRKADCREAYTNKPYPYFETQKIAIAEALYGAGYRKVLFDTENGKAVDVSQYAPWELIEGHTEREVEKARKETAREVLDMLYDEGIDKEILECCRIYDVNGVSLAKQICEKYDVEVDV